MRVVQAATCDRCCRHSRRYQRADHARRRARSASVHGISRLSADIKDVAVQSDPGLVGAYAPDGRTTPGSSDESGPPEAVLTEEDLRQHLRSMTTTVQSAKYRELVGHSLPPFDFSIASFLDGGLSCLAGWLKSSGVHRARVPPRLIRATARMVRRCRLPLPRPARSSGCTRFCRARNSTRADRRRRSRRWSESPADPPTR